MVDVLRINVTDDRLDDPEEVWSHDVPLGTSFADIGLAIQTLYPTANEIHIFAVDDEKAV